MPGIRGFDLPQTAQVTTKLYNVQGAVQSQLCGPRYDGGSHELNFSGNFNRGLPAPAYPRANVRPPKTVLLK
ncbi:MAG: hypothetical protein IPP40_18215 [bacterium]|nr:hypothetical protein [bacterium]